MNHYLFCLVADSASFKLAIRQLSFGFLKTYLLFEQKSSYNVYLCEEIKN